MMRKFQEEYLWEQKHHADDARANQVRIAQKKAMESACLNMIGVKADHDIIHLKQLTNQFKIHKFILKDPLLAKVTQSSMKKKVDWQATVLA
jgi:ribosomal protein S5